MRYFLIASLLFVVGCGSSESQPPETAQHEPVVYEGVYQQAMEHQGFTKAGSSEVWWVDGQEEILNVVSLTPMEDGALLMEGKAQVKLKGVLSEPGSYGHFGMFKHELKVLEVLECTPLTGGPTMEEAIEMNMWESP